MSTEIIFRQCRKPRLTNEQQTVDRGLDEKEDFSAREVERTLPHIQTVTID